MNYLRSLLLLACCLLASFAQAQNGQKYQIVRWHLQPDALQNFVTEIGKYDAVYTKHVNYDWSFYAYDDNTVEVVVPIRDYAELDRLDAAFDFSWGMLPEAEAKELQNSTKMEQVIKKSEDFVVESLPELSYVPTGEEALAGEMKAYRLDRHQTSFGVDKKIKDHGVKFVELLKKVNSPIHMEFYIYDMGDQQIFEVTYAGKDRADLDRRMKKHDELIAGPEWDAWLKTALELAPREHSTYATKIEELGHQREASTTRMFAVRMDHLKPGKADAYLAGAAKTNKNLRTAGADFYWSGNLLSDNRVMYFAPIQTMGDIDKVNEELDKRAYQLTAEQQKEARSDFAGLTSGTESRVLKQHESLGFRQQERYADDDYKVFKAVTYEYDPDNSAKVDAFLKNTKALFEKVGGNSPYEVWTNEFGGPTNQIIIVDWGKDKASLDANMEADMKLMDAAWVKQVTSLFTEVETVYGETRAELSYWPEE